MPIEWRGRPASAWLPDPLAQLDLALSEPTVRATEQAAAAARGGSDALPARWEPLARLLLRAEGLASSHIEGVRAPLADVAAAELHPAGHDTAAWVADNLAAVTDALAEARQHAPLRVESLHRWHRRLMAGASSHLPTHRVGALRDAQGWIGGTSPLDAALVPPPPEHVPALMDDLVVFVNRADLDPVTQAALAHAQLEVIHPYADGNGRVGRVLIGWVLTRRLMLVSPPPVSARIAVDRGGYLSGLTLFRLGQPDPWIRWFADVVRAAGQATTNLIRAVADLQTSWDVRLTGVRVGAAARRVLAVLPQYPVLDAATLAHALGVSERASRTALTTLAAHQIVAPFHPHGSAVGRPRQWWVAEELVDLVTAWSR